MILQEGWQYIGEIKREHWSNKEEAYFTVVVILGD